MSTSDSTSLPSRRPPSGYVGLAVDVLLFASLLAWGDIVFLSVLDVSAGQQSVSSGWTPGGGFGLSPRGGDVIGVGLTGLVLALQVPFLWRGRTLGLSMMGLELRRRGRAAPLVLSLLWTFATWTISTVAIVSVVNSLAVYLSAGAQEVTMASAGVWLFIAVVHTASGAVLGRSGLDYAFGLHVQRRTDPVADEQDVEPTAWKPRENFVVKRTGPVDKDAALWRANMSVDPFNAFVGPASPPMAETFDEPEHLEFIEESAPIVQARSGRNRGQDVIR